VLYDLPQTPQNGSIGIPWPEDWGSGLQRPQLMDCLATSPRRPRDLLVGSFQALFETRNAPPRGGYSARHLEMEMLVQTPRRRPICSPKSPTTWTSKACSWWSRKSLKALQLKPRHAGALNMPRFTFCGGSHTHAKAKPYSNSWSPSS
jgi:hypothetical protein